MLQPLPKILADIIEINGKFEQRFFPLGAGPHLLRYYTVKFCLSSECSTVQDAGFELATTASED